MKRNATTTCSHCKGTGQAPIPDVYQVTLDKLQRMTRVGTACVAVRAAEYFGCSPTALNNRLAWLERHGFATSERFGRERRYRAV
jgi:hypothetical protein